MTQTRQKLLIEKNLRLDNKFFLNVFCFFFVLERFLQKKETFLFAKKMIFLILIKAKLKFFIN